MSHKFISYAVLRVLKTLELLYKKPLQWIGMRRLASQFYSLAYARVKLELVAYDLPAIFQKKDSEKLG